jgi:hypothetical protein
VVGASAGGFGPVTVTSPTSALAQLTLDPLAVAGPRTATIKIGIQTASLVSSLNVSPKDIVPWNQSSLQVALLTGTGKGFDVAFQVSVPVRNLTSSASPDIQPFVIGLLPGQFDQVSPGNEQVVRVSLAASSEAQSGHFEGMFFAQTGSSLAGVMSPLNVEVDLSESSDAAALWSDAPADRSPTIPGGIGEPQTGSDFGDEVERGRKSV